MSHVGTDENDIRDLKGLSLSDETKQEVHQARIEARSIIDRLESLHLMGWAELIWTLEDCLHRAKFSMTLFCKSLSQEKLESILAQRRGIRDELDKPKRKT